MKREAVEVTLTENDRIRECKQLNYRIREGKVHAGCKAEVTTVKYILGRMKRDDYLRIGNLASTNGVCTDTI